MPGYKNWAHYVAGIRSRRSTKVMRRKYSRGGSKRQHGKKFGGISSISRNVLRSNYNSGFWANTCIKTMRYAEMVYPITGSTAGVFGTETLFSLVNPSHVYNGVSTHAVYGWSEAKAMYHQYKVIGVTARVWVNSSDHQDNCLLVAFQSSLDTFTYSGSTTKYAAEKPGNTLLFATQGSSYGGGPLAQPSSVERYISIPQIEGITPAQHRADISLYCGLTANTAGPTRYPTLCVAVGNAGGNNSSQMNIGVELIYTIKFWDRITQTYSS